MNPTDKQRHFRRGARLPTAAALFGVLIGLSGLGGAQDVQSDEEIIRSQTVDLLPAPEPEEYFFYFRDERGYIVYLPPATAVEYFSREITKLLPLTSHVDIYHVYANEPSLERYRTPRGQWQIRFQVSMALESGRVAVWWSREGFLDEVVVEHYTDHCCAAGRIFKTASGAVLFRVQDTIIG